MHAKFSSENQMGRDHFDDQRGDMRILKCILEK
jgi:hypothetical protein